MTIIRIAAIALVLFGAGGAEAKAARDAADAANGAAMGSYTSEDPPGTYRGSLNFFEVSAEGRVQTSRF